MSVFAAVQIVEYEDYDNGTDLYHVDRYEYEEEYDERYGPAQKEREYSLSAQVSSNHQRSHLGLEKSFCGECYILAFSPQDIPEKGEKGEPGYLGLVRRNTSLEPEPTALTVCVCVCFIIMTSFEFPSDPMWGCNPKIEKHCTALGCLMVM